jgi:uncharacterized iron-regulated protein
MKYFFITLALFITMLSFAQDKSAYFIYSSENKKVIYNEMIQKLSEADIVFFGEYHNNSISHWLELCIAESLFDLKKDNLILGAEMFEADNQLIINEYLKNIIAEKNFEAEAKLWDNYSTDYKPFFNFAKTNDLKFIATNIPRRYASIVAKKDFEGLNSLSGDAKKYIAPLPIKFDPNVMCYKNMIDGNAGMGGHGNQNIAKAQAIKDATMSFFILQNWTKGKLFFHINGSYHSDNKEGICWYLKQENPNLKIVTITTVSQKNIEILENENLKLADFIIVVPENMTTTF